MLRFFAIFNLIIAVLAFIIIIFMMGYNAKAIEPMTCDQFIVLTTETQKQYLINEILKDKNTGIELSICIKRNIDKLREFVLRNCKANVNFDTTLDMLYSRIKTKCLMDNEFNPETDVWDDYEIPFFYTSD